MQDKIFINKILTSKTFKNKEVLKSMLEYFFNAKTQHQILTERSIAKDVFGRDDFDGTDDTIVRVNLHKLRLLLEQYTISEGQNDPFKASIPKGNYSLELIPNVESKVLNKSQNLVLVFKGILAFLLCLLLSIVAYLLINKSKANPFWSSFNNNKPTKIILCPPHFQKYEHKTSGRTLVVRDMSVNSELEEDSISKVLFPLQEYEHPELEFSYFMPSNVYPLPKLFESLYENKVRQVELFSLKEFNNKELNHNNIIFMGSIKTLDYLTQLLESSSISVVNNPLHLILNDTIHLNAENLPQEKYIDYALMVKMKGEAGNNILVVTSMYTTGISGMLSKLNDKHFLENSLQIGKNIPEEFELILKVKGVNFSNLDTEVIHFKER